VAAARQVPPAKPNLSHATIRYTLLPSSQLKRMNSSYSPRAKGRGKPEGEPRLEHLVQVRSLDARRRLGEVSETVADELVRGDLCT
jgi:hypothetical protein